LKSLNEGKGRMSAKELSNEQVGKLVIHDLKEIVAEKFRAGEGVLVIRSSMPDAAILMAVREAISYGKPFTVIPGNIGHILTDEMG
jgi:hypothetical protein